MKNNGGDDQQRTSSSKVMYFSNLCYGGKHKIACFSQLQYQLSCCIKLLSNCRFGLETLLVAVEGHGARM